MIENQLDPNQEGIIPEIHIDEVKKRSISGILALTSRTILVQIIGFLSTLALTIFLDPSIYGIFFLVSSVVNFLAYFSDIGLAAALIQKKSQITREDLVTTFTIQQVLVLTLLSLLFILTPLITKFYSINADGTMLMWAMATSLFLSSLKTIPSVILEREIKFNRLVIPQIVEMLIFNLTAVYFAWRGFGINAFTYAVLLRGISGLIVMYLVSPWKPGLGFSRASLSHLLKFGLPYQANTFLAVIKDDGMTIFLGKLVGAQGLGYLGWASRWANLPLRIFLDNVTKVAFPAFSRMQHHPLELKKAIEMSLKYLTLVVFPALVIMAFFSVPLVNLIPHYTKWLPAIIPLYFYLFNAAWASISTMLTNALSATGHIKTTFKLMIMWTGLTWALYPILAGKYGYLGVSYAVGIIALSSIFSIIALKRQVNFNLTQSFRTPIICSLILAAFCYLVRYQVISVITLILFMLIGVLLYLSVAVILEGRDFFRKTLNYFKLKHA
jgi:O-antigen/teichoic acid export membrane protein